MPRHARPAPASPAASRAAFSPRTAARRAVPRLLAALLALGALQAVPAHEKEGRGRRGAAADASVPGELSLPHPTLHHLSVVWAVDGDANGDGVVGVRYRPLGSRAWRTGMDLLRVPEGGLPEAGFRWSARHAGSILDLQPDTAYEVELSLKDPDGGSTVRTVTARTRAVPAPMPGAPVRRVDPEGFAAAAARARPGEVLQLEPGTYPGFAFPRDGAPGRPIVIRADGRVLIDGDIDLSGRRHLIVQGLKVEGSIRFNRSADIAIVRNTIRTKRDGIHSRLRSENAYIADNTVIGPTEWAESALGVDGRNRGEGIQLTGPGHVVMHNRVKGFRDGISLMEGGEAVDQYSIDILNNDVSVGADDGIEADFCFHNCRVMRNRIANSFIGISSQPSLGGPTYFVRNVMYNVLLTPFKLHNGSVGNVILHNTVVKNGDAFGVYSSVPFGQTLMRNNLFIGGPGAGSFGGYSTGSGRAISMQALDARTVSMDYDAFGSIGGEFSARLNGTSFSSLDALRSGTTQKRAIRIGLDSFAAEVAYPAEPMTEYAVPDLRLGRGSPAVDSAVPIANINDDFSGKAPDRGAYELGAPLPVYGPRP
ncbi:right-handed parallel beta-helix repeat-containing protein [Caldimonas tepidiphila]|uniref:right-handed parallel beta-helix repeat-containing protein n=1 Tax=Caldimonas tepidiphila TaxID=2315841 RepID=UPI000E5A40D6|nr:right-handed parallel beta-helix repeat-containing protein [Caldimonas tepidiphila]